MLAAGLGIMRSALLRLRWLFCVFFVLNEFDISDLRFWRRRNQEEESEQEAGQKQADVKNVRTAGSLGHFEEIIVIESFALHMSGFVESVSGCEHSKRKEKPDEHE